MKRGILALVIALAAGLGVAYAALMPQRNVPALPPIERIVVDKSERKMMLYSGGQLVHTITGLQLGDEPVGHKQFEGDERTPEGRYTIDGSNQNSAYHLSLHISYPRAEDRAFAQAQGRSPGGQIFIHGQPNSLPAGRIPGDWTDGCIAVSNAEIEALWGAVPDGTVIDILP
jgi:murein L,D-transpeptidase YafK